METQPNSLIFDEKALKQDGKRWLSIPNLIKLIFIIIIAVIPLELFFGYKYLKGESLPSFSLGPQTSQAKVGDNASIFLIPQNQDLKAGDQVNVVVKLATFGRSIGSATEVIKYDPKKIDLLTDNPFTKGDVYSANPVVTKNALTGIIKITGQTGTPADGYTGVGILGTLRFKTKLAGNIVLSIENGSQAIEHTTGKDILGKSSNLQLNVK